MKRISLLTLCAFLSALISCKEKGNNYMPYSTDSNYKVISNKDWNLNKVSELISDGRKVIYDGNSSLFNAKNEFSNYKIKFSEDSSIQVFEKNYLKETGKWKFINSGSQIQIKKTKEGENIILHINRIESNELIFTQNLGNKLLQFDFSQE
jgi:hypothetical protein